MRMYVFFNRRLIVVETNLAFALPYWKRRRANDDKITWRIE